MISVEPGAAIGGNRAETHPRPRQIMESPRRPVAGEPLLVPLDNQTIFASVRKTGKLLIVEESNVTGGWGAEVAARVADECINDLDTPIRRVAAPDTPVPFAPVMENYYIPSVERIVSAVREVC